jgi:tight adherence protein B
VVVARAAAVVPGWDADLAWTVWVGCVSAAAVGAWAVGGPALAVLAAGALVIGPVAAQGPRRRRACERAGAEVPAVLEAAARALRAGCSLHGALEEAAASAGPVVGAVFNEVVAAVARGQPLVDALDRRRADGSGVPGLRLACTALAVAAATGGPQAAALDGVAITLRQRLAARAEAKALASQARTSAMVIALAPVGFAVLASAADRHNAAFLLRTPLGLSVLVAGLVLDGLGAVWMRRLTRIGGP